LYAVAIQIETIAKRVKLKPQISKTDMTDRRHIWKYIFGYNSSTDYPICVNHVRRRKIQPQWRSNVKNIMMSAIGVKGLQCWLKKPETNICY